MIMIFVAIMMILISNVKVLDSHLVIIIFRMIILIVKLMDVIDSLFVNLCLLVHNLLQRVQSESDYLLASYLLPSAH